MLITENREVKLLIADIETLKVYTLLSFYNPGTEEWFEFEINEWKNDLYEFVKFYKKENWEYVVGYNYLGFDAVIIEFILRNYTKWIDLSNLQICGKIYEKVQNHIDNQKFGGFSEYRQSDFEIVPLDVFTILGLDNAARMSSLKKVEFQLDMENVEEMPIFHGVETITKEECKEVKSYCRNDILATFIVFKLVLGDTEHPLYKGNNQLALRFDIKEEFGIDCLSYSEIKIGDELMKKSYAEAKGCNLYELPKKGTFRKSIALKNCIPKYVEFKTKELQDILKSLKKKDVKQGENHEVVFNFGKLKTEYTIGLGGGHSTNHNQVYKKTDEILIIDLDVQSLYPAIFCNEGLYPVHLGKELLKVYKQLYERRIELKPLSKTDKKIKGICDAIKLILNSFYGKVGSMESWSYDKQVPYAICLTGQLNLLMLIEEMELNDINCFSFNTDGATFIVNTNKLEKFYSISKEWEQKTNLLLEEQRFDKLFYSSVNDYIGITSEGKIKNKGEFLKDFDLWKNKSWRVVPMALEEYFVNGKNPVEFINNHENIFDFCLMTRATGGLYLEEQIEKNGNIEIIKHKKLIRYYLCKNSKSQLFKRGIGTTGKNTNISLHADNELGSIEIKYFNKYENKPFEEYNVDKAQYIFKCLKIMDKIEKTNKAKSFIESLKQQKQINLF